MHVTFLGVVIARVFEARGAYAPIGNTVYVRHYGVYF